jgi:dihydroflavonol-4-reductase
VIVQPCGVYGPGDHSIIGELLWVFRHGLMLAVPGPDTIISFVHVEDVADGIILAGDRGRVGESYLLGGPNLTFAEVMALWAEVTGKRAPPVAIPSGFLHRFAPLMGWVERVIPLPQMLRKEAICTLGASYAATSEKAIRELGWKPRPLRVGMKETFDAPANASRPPRRFTRRQRQAAGLVLAAMLVVAMASVIARRRGEAGGR